MPKPWEKKPEPPKDDEVKVEVDVDPEHEWRCQMLTQAGFTHFQAFRLSIGGADWHQAKALLDKGCDPEDVVEILT